LELQTVSVFGTASLREHTVTGQSVAKVNDNNEDLADPVSLRHDARVNKRSQQTTAYF
jgi:hypothetical protein